MRGPQPRTIRDVWWTRLHSVGLTITGVITAWTGLQFIGKAALPALAVTLIGGVAGSLGARSLARTARKPVNGRAHHSNDLSTVNVDVIIVSALALPVVLVGLLLVLAVTGNLDP